MAASDDAEKVHKHLTLLKQQYAKLQDRYYQLEQKYIKSQVAGDGSVSENSFVSQLVTMVGKLHEKDIYSDITIKMSNRTVPSHKIILVARSEAWNPSDPTLLETSEIDISDLSTTAASTLVKWIYTNSVLAFSDQALVIELLGAANKFKLKELKDRCEEWLIGNVTVRNCISLYQVSEDHQAANLKKYCLQVISDNWNDLETEDFVNLSPALLYEMFKAHSKYPLHLAIQHNREDVVFLFLVENSSQLAEKVNERNDSGDLPLDLALLMHSESIANTLVGNKCDVDTPNDEGKTLLHLAILRGDAFAAEFLIRNGASPLATISSTLETPLHLAASYSPSAALASFSSMIKKAPWPADDMEDITNLLLEYNANPDGQDSEGNTALHRAIIAKSNKVFKALMEHKLNLELRNNNGDTPLWLALKRFTLYKSLPDDDSEELKLSFASQLIQRGCNIETVDSQTGNSTLQRSAICGNEVAAIFLLHQGANPNHRNRKGETTLHLAAAGNLPRLTQVLLTSGADPNYQTNPTHQSSKTDGPPANTSRTSSPAMTRVRDSVEYPTSPTAITALNALSVISMATTNTNTGSLSFGSSEQQTSNPFGMSDEEEEPAPPMRHPGRPTFPKQKYHRIERQREDFALPFEASLFGSVESDQVEFVEDPQVFDVLDDKGGKTAIHIAIACKHTGVVTVLIGHRGLASSGKLMIPLNVNIQDCLGETPLGLALWTRQFQTARQLLEAGAEVEASSKENLTLLHLALLREQEEAAMFLLDNGANFKRMSPDGSSSLHMAIRHQLPSVVQYLCEHGVDLHHYDNKGNSPLWMALRSKQEDVAKCLVEHGCDANSWSPGPSRGMFTLLHRAIILNDTPTAVFLIKNGADINSPYRLGPSTEGVVEEEVYCAPPIHLACGLGLEVVVQCLVDNHSDVNQKDTNGSAPIHIAISTHHSSCAAHLLSHPSINLTLKDRNGLTPFACSLKHQDHHTGMAILTKEPEAAEQYDNKGQNFLHNAIRNQDVEAVMFLMSVHVDVNSKVKDRSLSTPLHLAIQTGSELLVRQLLLAGSKVTDIDSRSNGVLHMAVEGNSPTILSVLLENRADPDIADHDMNTPLHLSVKLGHIDCVKVLLEESAANLGVTNAIGQNILHTLAKYAHENAAAIFQLIIRSIKNFPLNIPDGEGNTALLLAYFNGHTGLCDSLVRAGAHPGIANRQGVSIFTAPAPTKQLLFRILDQIKLEPVWLDGQNCSNCQVKFGIATRKHHCRHCGRILCSKCTPTQLPILKFDVQKPVRLCVVCGDCLTLGAAR